MAVEAPKNSPTPSTSPSSTTTTEDANTLFDNPQQGRPPWPTRKRSYLSHSPPPPASEEDEHLALCLLMLAQGRRAAPPTSATAATNVAATLPTSTTVAKNATAALPTSTTVAKNATAALPTSTTVAKNATAALPTVTTANTDATARGSVENQNLESLNLPHKCPYCTRAFALHQALGGHTAGHHRKTNKNENLSTSLASGTSPPPPKKVHECHICHKTFLTGQALGGHKRLHYEGPPIHTSRSASSENNSAIVVGGGSASNETNSAIVVGGRSASNENNSVRVSGGGPASSSSQSQTENPKPSTGRGLDFDLNFLPTVETMERWIGFQDDEDAEETPLVRKKPRGPDVLVGS